MECKGFDRAEASKQALPLRGLISKGAEHLSGQLFKIGRDVVVGGAFRLMSDSIVCPVVVQRLDRQAIGERTEEVVELGQHPVVCTGAKASYQWMLWVNLVSHAVTIFHATPHSP